MSDNLRYHLGCPVWACDDWRGKIFPPGARRKEWLNLYSRIFNSVEGNTTFYAIPKIETVQKWAKETSDGFRFSLKFPKVITHDCRLVGCKLELNKFIECLEILHDADRLGPSFLQLPPDFAGSSISVLKHFLDELPENLPFAVEVRHDDYFGHPLENEFCETLIERNIDRVVFDSRPLFHFPPADISESEARRRKPKVPIRPKATGENPILRFVGINRIEKLQSWIKEWGVQIAHWIGEGRTPYVFAHTPDDKFAPAFAELIHQEVKKNIPELPDLPTPDFRSENQLGLFSD